MSTVCRFKVHTTRTTRLQTYSHTRMGMVSQLFSLTIALVLVLFFVLAYVCVTFFIPGYHSIYSYWCFVHPYWPSFLVCI